MIVSISFSLICGLFSLNPLFATLEGLDTTEGILSTAHASSLEQLVCCKVLLFPRAKSKMQLEPSQDYYMKNEQCFCVDENDQIIGFLSKFDAHRLDETTQKAPLHRAFSVFLLKRAPNNSFSLLMQQRSQHKITFPLLWSNSCCSHPIVGLQEDTPDVPIGIARAARRKLHHELGIPLSITECRMFYHCNRVQYHANQDPWGEHEIDHILLMEADDELIESIKINQIEVAAIKFVQLAGLESLDPAELTPWLQKILSTDLLDKWIKEIEIADGNVVEYGVKSTKYSSEPIIKL